jgi:hypothetical protein
VQLELNKADRCRQLGLCGERYELDQVDTESVPGLVCTNTFPKSEGSETAPIVYDRTLYAATAHYAGALNCRQDSSREGAVRNVRLIRVSCFLGTNFDVPGGFERCTATGPTPARLAGP